MTTAISFIVVFGLIVFFHELGHFALAKYNGVKVHEFALGMGPKVFQRKGIETEYSLRLFPIGGYVKMEGEDEESNDLRSFSNKSPLQRLSIIFAGPLMNFVLAFVVFVIISGFTGIPTTTINEVTDKSPALEAGIISGDEIIEINGEIVENWTDVIVLIQQKEKSINFVLNREGKKITKKITPKLTENGDRYIIGISPKVTKNPIKVVSKSANQVFYTSKAIFKFFAELPFRGMKKEEVVGPIGIVNLVGQASKRGFLNVLNLAAYISINLGIVNLLPLPALDGGRLVFILIELVRGKPIDPEKEGMVHLIGFAFLLLLMFVVVYNDIQRFF